MYKDWLEDKLKTFSTGMGYTIKRNNDPVSNDLKRHLVSVVEHKLNKIKALNEIWKGLYLAGIEHVIQNIENGEGVLRFVETFEKSYNELLVECVQFGLNNLNKNESEKKINELLYRLKNMKAKNDLWGKDSHRLFDKLPSLLLDYRINVLEIEKENSQNITIMSKEAQKLDTLRTPEVNQLITGINALVNSNLDFTLQNVEKTISKKQPFGVIWPQMTNITKLALLFSKQLSDLLAGKTKEQTYSIEKDVKSLFLTSIDKYEKWYLDKKEEIASKYESYNPFEIIFSDLIFIKNEILKYFPEQTLSPSQGNSNSEKSRQDEKVQDVEGEKKLRIDKIKKHFNFFQGNCPRKHKQILEYEDFNKLIKWTIYYYENQFKVPEISEPVKVVNTNKTYVQLAFKYLFKKLNKASPYPSSLFEFYKNAFSPYSEDKRKNFEGVHNDNEVKRLMQINY